MKTLDEAVTELRAYCNQQIGKVTAVGADGWPGGYKAFEVYNDLLKQCDEVFRVQDKRHGT